MTIVNPDKCDKIVWITGENFTDAVSKVKAEYGTDWYVRSCEIVYAQ
jgi:hypothetical protein